MTPLDMHCPVCGYINAQADPVSTCKACRAKLGKPFIDPYGESIFGINMKKAPLKKIISLFLEDTPPLKKIVLFPLVAWRTIARRLGAMPWVLPKYKGYAPKFIVRKLTADSGLDEHKLVNAMSEMEKNGFSKALDRLNVALSPPRFERLLINQEKRLYAVGFFARGEFNVAIYAPLKGGGAMPKAVNFNEGFYTDPASETIYKLRGSVRELVLALGSVVSSKKRDSENFGLRSFLVELANAHKRTVENVSSTLTLYPPQAGAQEAGLRPECSNHPGRMAIRRCALCGKPICQECHHQYDEHGYCPSCLPEGADRSGDPSIDLSGDYQPAGFALRSVVRITEAAIFLWFVVHFFPAQSGAGSIIAYQAIVIASFFIYFHLTVSGWGATPLGRLAGLSVVDDQGERLSAISSFVRMIYFLFSLLMFFPALGYLSVIWDKYNRGWHDRMAGSIVVSTHSTGKERFSVFLLGLLLAFGVYNHTPLYNFSLNGMNSTLQSITPAGAVFMESAWSHPSRGKKAFLDMPNVVVIEKGHVAAFDVESGKAVWEAAPIEAREVYGTPESKYYFAIRHRHGVATVIAIDKKTGEPKWEAIAPGEKIVDQVAIPGGVLIIAEKMVVAINNEGEIVWSVEPQGEPLALKYSANDLFVQTKNGTDIYNLNTGEHIISLAGLNPSMSQGSKYIFSGSAGTSLFDLVNERLLWSIAQNLKFVDDRPGFGKVIHSELGARRMADGKMAWRYPDGCTFTGAFSYVVALYCEKESELKIMNSNMGEELAKLPIGPVHHTQLLFEQGANIHLLLLTKTAGKSYKGRLVSMNHEKMTANIYNIGSFRKKPTVVSLPHGKVFIATKREFGVYKTPWGEAQ